MESNIQITDTTRELGSLLVTEAFIGEDPCLIYLGYQPPQSPDDKHWLTLLLRYVIEDGGSVTLEGLAHRRVFAAFIASFTVNDGPDGPGTIQVSNIPRTGWTSKEGERCFELVTPSAVQGLKSLRVCARELSGLLRAYVESYRFADDVLKALVLHAKAECGAIEGELLRVQHRYNVAESKLLRAKGATVKES